MSVAEAAAPLQVIEAESVFTTGPVFSDPEVGTTRLWPLLESVQEVALAEDQESVEDCPAVIVAGLNASLAEVRSAVLSPEAKTGVSARQRYASARIGSVIDVG